jgi:hypothetical protein
MHYIGFSEELNVDNNEFKCEIHKPLISKALLMKKMCAFGYVHLIYI